MAQGLRQRETGRHTMKKFLTNASESSKTTSGGLLAATMIIIDQIQALLDGNSETVMDVNVLIAAFGILWMGWNARDADK
jgi:hypothetical protein